jgi:hypothetical protein
LLNTGQDRHLFCSAFGYCSPSDSKPITGDRLKVASTSSRLGGIGSHLFKGLLGKCLAQLLLKSLPTPACSATPSTAVSNAVVPFERQFHG